jgi:hypothetical protein
VTAVSTVAKRIELRLQRETEQEYSRHYNATQVQEIGKLYSRHRRFPATANDRRM